MKALGITLVLVGAAVLFSPLGALAIGAIWLGVHLFVGDHQ